MLAEIGYISLALSFAAAVFGAAASLYGARRKQAMWIDSGRNAALLTFPLLLVSTLALLVGLMTQDYQISYVWAVTNPTTPMFYRVTALWGSQQGSLLFWNLLMAGFAFVALLANWKLNPRLMPYFTVYSMLTLAFFIGLVLFLENPFERYWIIPGADGVGEVVQAQFAPANAVAPEAARLAETARGLNPLLRHFGMIIHPPMLYLGFVGFLVPFAFAMAALASNDLSTNWIKATRRWTLVAWLFLSLGLLLGGRWAYDVLGWGGYWGWDPVENAAFIPWLVGTAFLHSVMIQEKRGMLKVWNMFLVIFTFSSVIFGTFATRSGLIDSVHSFARSEIGAPMFFFWAGVTIVSVALIVVRWSQGALKSEHGFAGVLSRESLFVLNNVVFVALALAIFWGSFGAPIITEMVTGTDITLGPDYFYTVTVPLFIAMYILMGIAPLSAWGAVSARSLGRSILVPVGVTLAAVVLIALTGVNDPGALFGYGVVLLAAFVAGYEIVRGARARARAAGEHPLLAAVSIFTRNRRRYGGFIIHLGITVIGIGVIGSTLFQQETQRTLAIGESLQFSGYELRLDSMEYGQIADDGRQMDIANLTLKRDDEVLTTLRPRHDVFPAAADQQPMVMNIPSAYGTLENDYYVLLVGVQPSGAVTFKVYVNPLINLVWWGGLVLIAGTLIASWPTGQKAEARQRVANAVAVQRGQVTV
ncbi:MAG: cytochrome c biogenesis protein CcsA [Pleurocapsa minor GSE-CHR-MK-17-07R]|jgi:cytochrome c-type biogenesis protein CcmF|nr:cytochrome c biogenesis protein CcsA [Pleurocapsa minor GSE-CHR-MK 17-07R]